MPAPTIVCVSCGAEASFFAQRCDPCGAALATVACPDCTTLIFRGEPRCSRCGAATAQLLRGGTRGFGCPRCELEGLALVTLGSVELAQCPRCYGTWLDNGSFNKLCRDHSVQLPLPSLSAPTLDGSRVSCPRCAAPMRRTNFGRFSGILVDTCVEHGLWFDRDELRGTLQFVREGGLESAWANDAPPSKRRPLRKRAAPGKPAQKAPPASDNSTAPDAIDVLELVAALIAALLD